MTKAKDETTEQRQSRLEIARKQAVKTREAKMIEKYRDKILSESNKKDAEANKEYEATSDDNDTEVEEKKQEKPKPKPKPKPKKEQVIIEQSSDDDDVFEDKPNVIFVKRVRGKNKVAPQPPNFHHDNKHHNNRFNSNRHNTNSE